LFHFSLEGWFHHYWRFKNDTWADKWMKFEMDAIESEPGTPETTRIIFQGKKLLKNFKPNHHGDNDAGDFMLVEDVQANQIDTDLTTRFIINIFCRRHLSPLVTHQHRSSLS